jgi:tetratricopeptide (TPR) repeat protein
MGRYEDAERYFIEALKREPHRTSAHNNLGNLYNTLGDFTKAEASYRRALKEVPHFYDAHRHLAQVKKFRDVLDPDIVTMEKELKQEELPVQKKMQLSFALGKAYDDIGISERAFAHLLIGNMHKRERFSFSMDREERKCDALISYFSEPLPKEKGHPSDQPIFILGMPRSGTSLCEQILATHSQVYGGGELSAMGKVKKQIQRSTSDGFPFGLSEMHERECRALGELYLEYLQKVGKGRFITDKMPNNFMMVGLIRTILPNAKIIYCRRDPRDNGLSLFLRYFIGYHGYAYNLEEIASYLVMQNRLMKHWMNIFGEHIFVLDYEEMVADQEKTTERLLRYCDLSYEPALAEFYKTKRGVATASAMQVRTPIYRSSVGKWKRYESELKPMLDILKQAGLC